jgi:hypothetical protein
MICAKALLRNMGGGLAVKNSGFEEDKNHSKKVGGLIQTSPGFAHSPIKNRYYSKRPHQAPRVLGHVVQTQLEESSVQSLRSHGLSLSPP